MEARVPLESGKHFHLGDPSTWSKADDKIIIKEMRSYYWICAASTSGRSAPTGSAARRSDQVSDVDHACPPVLVEPNLENVQLQGPRALLDMMFYAQEVVGDPPDSLLWTQTSSATCADAKKRRSDCEVYHRRRRRPTRTSASTNPVGTRTNRISCSEDNSLPF
jgi:hypothetical protein